MKKISKKAGRGAGFIAVLTSAVLAAVFVMTGAFVVYDMEHISISETVNFEIPQGAGVVAVGNQLKKQGVIRFPMAFRLVARFQGFEGSLRPGTIAIEPGMSYEEILRQMSKDHTKFVKLIIPEGFEIRQIAERVEAAGLVTREEFYGALDPGGYSYRFLEGIDRTENVLEGYLFPATYEIPADATAHEIVNLMLVAFDQNFTDAYYDRCEELNMTVDEIVTLASIVERETDSSGERAKVAGVFYNRLAQNMRLQSCATIQYILKERKPNLTKADTRIESLYNTYLHEGLPAGPIASPGLACIQAVLYPEETDAMYFVLGADGQHSFSKTYEEHLAAKNHAKVKVTE